MFNKCVPTLEYEEELGSFINMNRRENMDIDLKDGLTFRIKTFIRTDKGRELREDKDVLELEDLLSSV